MTHSNRPGLGPCLIKAEAIHIAFTWLMAIWTTGLAYHLMRRDDEKLGDDRTG